MIGERNMKSETIKEEKLKRGIEERENEIRN
jgi:hypothetical protein